MTLYSTKRHRINIFWAPFGRKFYYSKLIVHWGNVRQIGLWPFWVLIDTFDDYEMAHGR